MFDAKISAVFADALLVAEITDETVDVTNVSRLQIVTRIDLSFKQLHALWGLIMRVTTFLVLVLCRFSRKLCWLQKKKIRTYELVICTFWDCWVFAALAFTEVTCIVSLKNYWSSLLYCTCACVVCFLTRITWVLGVCHIVSERIRPSGLIIWQDLIYFSERS